MLKSSTEWVRSSMLPGSELTLRVFIRFHNLERIGFSRLWPSGYCPRGLYLTLMILDSYFTTKVLLLSTRAKHYVYTHKSHWRHSRWSHQHVNSLWKHENQTTICCVSSVVTWVHMLYTCIYEYYIDVCMHTSGGDLIVVRLPSYVKVPVCIEWSDVYWLWVQDW